MVQTRINLRQADWEGSVSGFVSDEELQSASGVLQTQIDTRVTDGLNLGDGSGVFAQKNGTILEFKTLNGGLGIDIVANPVDTAEELDIVFNINEVPDLGPVVSGLFYRRDQNLESSFDGVTTEDYVFRIGDFDSHYTAVFAASGVFVGPASEGGKVVFANPDDTLETAVFERGFPGAFPALTLRGGRAIIMETFDTLVTVSGFWMGPTQRILMGDLEDYSFDTTLLYAKELANFGKKVTSVLVNDPLDGAGADTVGHYSFHKARVTSNNNRRLLAHEAKIQIKMDGDLNNRATALDAIVSNIDGGEQTVTGTYEGINARVVHSGGGVVDTAKAGYFGIDNPGAGRIDKVFVVHIGSPSGAQTIGKSLWCEGESFFEDSMEIDGNLNLDGSLNVQTSAVLQSILTVAGTTTLNGIANLNGATTIDDTLDVVDDAQFDANVGVSGVLETALRRDASRREVMGLFDNVAFDRNLIYLSLSSSASVISITDPGEHGQLTKVIFQQNGAGTGVFSWSYSGGIRWRGGTQPTLSPVANARDVLTFLYDAVDDVLYADYSQGFV